MYTWSWLCKGILKGEVSLYRWPPIWLVWNQLYDYWQFLCFYLQNRLVQTSQTGGQRYSDTSPLVFPGCVKLNDQCIHWESSCFCPNSTRKEIFKRTSLSKVRFFSAILCIAALRTISSSFVAVHAGIFKSTSWTKLPLDTETKTVIKFRFKKTPPPNFATTWQHVLRLCFFTFIQRTIRKTSRT